MGARVGGAIIALSRGDDPAAGRDALADIAREIALARDTDALELGPQEAKVQRALAGALAAPDSQERAARLKNAARLLPLIRAVQDLPDEKGLVRQTRPAYRVLRATLVGTRARLLLALPDVIDKALASTDPGLVAAINSHKEALEDAQALVAASAILAEPGRAAEPPTAERWRHVADQLLKLGQEMGRPESRSRALLAHHDLLTQVQRYALLPGEDELVSAGRGISSPVLHSDAWAALTGGKAAELAARVGAARSRWSVAVGAKGKATDAELRPMEELRELMRVASALAALDIGADGTPGPGAAGLGAWAAWELSPAAVQASAAPAARALPELVAGLLDPKGADLTDRIADLGRQAGVVIPAGELARAARARGIAPGPVLRECAIGGPPPQAWRRQDLAPVAGICRYAEEAAAARRLGNAARAAELDAYIATLAGGLSPAGAPAR
jgi:hypothetical protein